MSATFSQLEKAKFVAAKRALDYVSDGMRVGLGTGSTAAWMVKMLGEMVREDGLRIQAVATSSRTAQLAKDVGLEVLTLDQVKWLDLTIDGTDEFDPLLNLIKGGGGALLQEKIVAMASDQIVIIADASKSVDTLGAFALPVEVVKFGWETTLELIRECLLNVHVMGSEIALRLQNDTPLITDEGHYILDLDLKRIENPSEVSFALNQVPGVVENGLFLDVVDAIVIGHGDGRVEVRDVNHGTVEHEYIDILLNENLFADIED